MKLNFLGKILKLKGIDQYLDGSMHQSGNILCYSLYWYCTLAADKEERRTLTYKGTAH